MIEVAIIAGAVGAMALYGLAESVIRRWRQAQRERGFARRIRKHTRGWK